MPQAIAVFVTSSLGLTGVAATLVTSALQLGIGLALSSALQPDVPDTQPEDGRIMFTRDVGPRVKSYGRRLVGGQVVFGRAGGAGSDPADPTPGADETVEKGRFLHRIVVHAHGRAERIIEVRLDAQRRRIEVDGRVLSEGMGAVGGFGGSRLRVRHRLGDVPSVAYEGPADAASSWSAAHRLDGLVTSYIRAEQRAPADQQKTYPRGPTELQVLADFSRVHDPREQADVYTDNAALVIADWIEGPDGFGRAGALYLPDLIVAADRADVLRPLASGGSVRSWRLAGGASLAEPPGTALRGMLDACAGDIRARPDGTWSLNIGPDPEPVMTLTERDLVEILEMDDGTGALDRYTTLPATYIDETLDYTRTTADPWVNAAELSRLGQEVIAGQIDLGWCPYHAQARHALKILSQRQNPPERVRLRVYPSALPAIYERTVRLDMPLFGLSGTWRVTPGDFELQGRTLTLELARILPGQQTWTVAEEGAPLALPPATPDADAPPPQPAGVQAFGNGAPGDAGILIAFDAPFDGDVTIHLATSPAGADTWTAGAAGASPLRASGLVDGDLYDVAVIAARSEIYDPTDPDVTTLIVPNVRAETEDPAPGLPSLKVADGGTGVAIATVTAPEDVYLREVQLLRDGVVVATARVQPGISVELSDSSGLGLRAWTARGVSISGRAGPETAPVEALIT